MREDANEWREERTKEDEDEEGEKKEESLRVNLRRKSAAPADSSAGVIKKLSCSTIRRLERRQRDFSTSFFHRGGELEDRGASAGHAERSG